MAVPPAGYNYRVEAHVIGQSFAVLLDTGASVSAVPEEIIVGLLNEAFDQGLTPEDPAWPVQLERWDKEEKVPGVRKDRPMEVIGAAVVPLVFTGANGAQRTQRLRFKIFRRGSSTWMGFIVGGPSLEAGPVGLGLRTTPEGHYLETLGLCCPRQEASEVRRLREACGVAGPSSSDEESSEDSALTAVESRTEEQGSQVSTVSSPPDQEDQESSLGEVGDDFWAWMGDGAEMPSSECSMSPVVFMGMEIGIEPGDHAVVPAAVQSPMGSPVRIKPATQSSVRSDPEVWDVFVGTLRVVNEGLRRISIKTGEVVAVGWMPPRELDSGVGVRDEERLRPLIKGCRGAEWESEHDPAWGPEECPECEGPPENSSGTAARAVDGGDEFVFEKGMEYSQHPPCEVERTPVGIPKQSGLKDSPAPWALGMRVQDQQRLRMKSGTLLLKGGVVPGSCLRCALGDMSTIGGEGCNDPQDESQVGSRKENDSGWREPRQRAAEEQPEQPGGLDLKKTGGEEAVSIIKNEAAAHPRKRDRSGQQLRARDRSEGPSRPAAVGAVVE